jgi:hypothetical protein
VKIKTTCKKPKKQKKDSDGAAVTGDGVGGGKGGKGGKGGRSNSNVNADTTGTTVTSNSTSSTTSSSSTNTTSTTATTANSNSTDAYRSLQTNSTNSNVVGNQTSSTNTTNTNTTTSTVSSNNTPNTTYVVTVSSKKSGKKGTKQSQPKVSADEIPFCEEDEDDDASVNAPSVPVRSPASSPAMVAGPSASVQSPTTDAAAPSGTSVQSPAVSSPTVNNPALVPSDSNVVTEASICEAYRFGVAPTDGPSQNHTTFITMNVDVGSDISSIYTQVGTVLREKIGPLLLDCVSERRLAVQRDAQENTTELVNVLFSTPTFTGGKYIIMRFLWCFLVLMYLS